MKKLKIGFIGNFNVSYTTENERKYALEQLGHTVIPFQENHTTAEQLLMHVDKLDALFYSHTHGWMIESLRDVFNAYKRVKTPTVTVHLDLWHGLERWKDVGSEATWFCEYIFMPVEADDWGHGIKTYYMRPGVSEKGCYIAEPNVSKFPYEIVFTGSKSYHPEYPERPKLIEFLETTYKNSFGLYGNQGIRVVREHDLNVLYASSKIVIGDSCFSQTKTAPKGYYSDRVTEVLGRGGFLLHPRIEALEEIDGLVLWDNLEDLKNKIDYYLIDDKEREELRIKGHEWVKKYSTYTVIMQEILDIVIKEHARKNKI